LTHDDLYTVTLYTTGKTNEDIFIEVRRARLMRVAVKGTPKIDLSVSVT